MAQDEGGLLRDTWAKFKRITERPETDLDQLCESAAVEIEHLRDRPRNR